MEFEAVATSVGLLLTAIGLAYAGRQLQLQRKLARGTFILQLQEMLASHDEVHRRLDRDDCVPWEPREEDWPAVEAYMGLFERMQLLVEDGILDIDTVDRLYTYRVRNIFKNPHVRREKLVRKREYWRFLLDLGEVLQSRELWKSMDRFDTESEKNAVRPSAPERADAHVGSVQDRQRK